MPRKMTGRAALAALTLTASCVFAVGWSAGPAEAESGTPPCSGSGGSSGGGSGSGIDFTLWNALTVNTPMCPDGGNAGQTDGTATASVYVPCWWGPKYDPQGLQAAVESFDGQSSTDGWYMMLSYEYDRNGTGPFTSGYRSDSGPPWESYNVGATPEGEWYGMDFNPVDTLDQIDTCNKEETALGAKMYFWSDNGKPPADMPSDAPGFSEQDLAQYIDKVIQLPYADTGTDPAGKSTVNVPVWYWQDADANTLDVNHICAFGTCVDFHAQAVSFVIEDAGAPAKTDSSGCKLNSDTGVLGTKYQASDGNGASDCGVTYTGPGSGTPWVRTYWAVDITWPGGHWSPPTNPYVDTQLDPVTVQEIQAYNASPTATS